MLEFLFSLITRISLMISSFLGCCWRFICLMATWGKKQEFVTEHMMTSHRINKLHRLNGLSSVWRTSWPVAMSMAVYTVPDALRKYKMSLIEQKFNLHMYQIWPTQKTVTDFCINLNNLPTWCTNTVEHIINDQKKDLIWGQTDTKTHLNCDFF